VNFTDTTPAATQVAAVSNIHYELVGEDVHLEFTRPADTSHIARYYVEFSSNGGASWGNGYVVGTADGQFVPMGDLALSVTTTTTFDKVRVTSVAATGYTDNAATDTDSFTFTVSDTAVGFTVEQNSDNNYTVKVTANPAVASDELYGVKVSMADSAPTYYPLGYVYSYDSLDDKSIIPLSGDEDYKIVNGSQFEVRKITIVSTSEMTVSKYAAPVSSTLPQD